MLWLIGNKGMLGTELSLLLEKRGLPFTGTDREVDIADPAALAAFAAALRPGKADGAADNDKRWIINCAAYTAVDKAEDDAETCRRLNTLGAANIAATAKNSGARLVHISTDYVFDGKGVPAGTVSGGSGKSFALRPYREDDPTNPVGVYGLTKRDGELEVMKNNPQSYIIRTAWLYGKHGNNFVATMLRLMNERDEVKVVNDQRGSPTWARDLAETIVEIIKTDRKPAYGIYHYTGEGGISWFDFAVKIYNEGRARGLLKKDCAVKPCTSAEFPARVKRPAYSVLDKTRIKAALGISIPEWTKSLEKFLMEID
jgi:dTDP-4-dehydrorhamnose reductase